mmetsp:Transcript_37957/g.89484  ORF Transcript_37957/g.89484 Transcript_37957/m.89484 type:complete len:675 (-) Transcript_37957:195-2219(-)
MTEVLARARELVKAIPDVVSKNTGGEKKDEEEGGPDSILIHFRDEGKRLESFKDHGGWKLERPTPKDLSAAGFFFAPLPACEDRVACYACGKVLFNWDPNDHIPDAHKLFSPNCPLVTGKPVEIPSNIKKKMEPAPWAAPAPTQEEKVSVTANFSSFVANLQKTAITVEPQVGIVSKVAKKTRKAKKDGDGKYPSALTASTSDDNTASDGDGIVGHEESPNPDATIKSLLPGAKARSERLWNFDWSVPSAFKSGLSGDAAILDAQAGAVEMRLETAKRLMVEKQDDWVCAGLQVEAKCRQMQEELDAKLQGADDKVAGMQAKVSRIARGLRLLRDDATVAERAKELGRMREEKEALEHERAKAQAELEELRKATAAEQEDLELIKNKQRLTAELDEKLGAQREETLELEERAREAAEAEAEARQQKHAMETSMVQVRDELRDEISELHQAKLGQEEALAEMTEQMLRVKRLYSEYKSRLEELQRREGLCDSREQEGRTREEFLARRESTLKTREEWMAKREADFRIQQRALENAQLFPKGSLAGMGLPVSSAHSGGEGGSGSEGRGSELDGDRGGLAEQVMQAQAHYANRVGQTQGGAMTVPKGKGRGDTSQRDYKAILSTAESADPRIEREAAKAARKRDMLMGFIPKLGSKGDKKTSKSAAPAGSFFDMNSI